jgi:hypothetical protein
MASPPHSFAPEADGFQPGSRGPENNLKKKIA